MQQRHFLTGQELDQKSLLTLVERAHQLKEKPLSSRALAGQSVALIFELPSTRTRLSFETGIFELGGHPLVLRPGELQLSRGEPISDTARVLSRHVAAIGARWPSDEDLLELANHATVPVFNMLTAAHHPCQILADLMTIEEAFGTLQGLRLTYLGDGSNVARSLAFLGARAGLEVTIASPAAFALDDLPADVRQVNNPREAVVGANVLYTDVWVSMSDDQATADRRREALAPYQINSELLALAEENAVVLHCLPAHIGDEVTDTILYGQRQRIWDQAENRRHAQKAMLEWLTT